MAGGASGETEMESMTATRVSWAATAAAVLGLALYSGARTASGSAGVAQAGAARAGAPEASASLASQTVPPGSIETPDGVFPPITFAPGPFSPTEESLKTYQYPEWFRDAKLGIWAHWGPQSVPMEGDWYAKRMYQQGDKDYIDHLARYGHPSEPGHGYKDIIPLWKAEKWDPEGLMALYKKAGAKYFVAQAVHHDNFDNWNSKWHKWNSVKMGPMRDVVGDWQKAAVKEGLRFGVSEHLGASFTWFQASHGADKTGPFAGRPYDGADPAYADLYHWPAAADDKGWLSIDPRWQAEWYARIKDVVDQYHPDLLYSDSGLPFNNVGRSLIAHLYNTAAAKNGGVADAVYNCKQDSQGQWVQDVERGGMAGVNPYPWQTDTSIGDWYYNKHWKYRDAQWVVHSLVDIVSKNGNLLINVVQRPDGTLDDEATKVVEDLAAWMHVNSEGIYGTRPWTVYGEGKKRSRGGAFNEDHSYTADDVRFTTKGDGTLYAYALGWPAGGKVAIRSLAAFPGAEGKISRVTLLGHSGELKWTRDGEAVTVQLPDARPCDFAFGLKIEVDSLKGFKPELAAPQVATVKPDAAGAFELLATAGDLGGALAIEQIGGQPSVGFWSNPKDDIAWRVSFPAAGKYRVTAEVAAGAGDSDLAVVVGAQKVHAAVPASGGWDKFATVELGTLTIGKAGDQDLIVKPASAKSWKVVNLRNVKLVPVP
jgi:alpha-L-fucosidase